VPLGVAATISLLAPVAGATPTATALTHASVRLPSTLTNLAHLDFLTAQVTVVDTAAHSTYRLAREPQVGVLWVYANALGGGAFARVGGGAYDAVTNTCWGPSPAGSRPGRGRWRAATGWARRWRSD
jgi:hypothetical protein